MPRSGFTGLSGLLSALSSNVAETIWGYISPGADKVEPLAEAKVETSLEESLQELYGEATPIAVRQAEHVLHEEYDGNMEEFLTEFFYPAINLLTKLMKLEKKQAEGRRIQISEGPEGNSNQNETTSSDCLQDVSKQTDIPKQTTAALGCDNHYHSNREDTLANPHTDDLSSSKSCHNPAYNAGHRHTFKSPKWPVAVKDSVVVNLQDLPDSRLISGDIYFYVKQTESGQVALWVKYCLSGTTEEQCVYESYFGRVFTMDWLEDFPMESTEDIGESLRFCLLSLEDSIDKLRWEDIVPHMGQRHAGKVRLKQSHISSPASAPSPASVRNAKSLKDLQNSCVKCEKQSVSTGNLNDNKGNNSYRLTDQRDASYSQELRASGMDSTDGREIDKPRSPRSPGLHKHRHLEPPKTILDVDYKLLQSGVAILPGNRDLEDNAVVLIFTSSSLWKNQQVTSTDLTRLIMYYYSVPRETVRCRGLSIIADIRGCTASTINTLLESLYLFEGNIPQAISVVHLLSDKHTRSLAVKSPIYDVHASFQIDLLLSSQLLSSYISASQLPLVLEGSFQYSHDDWIRFHMRFDPFAASCRAVAKYLLNIIQELSVVDQIPASAEEASHLVNHHENLMKAVFEDPRVKRLQNEGESMYHSLEREEENIGHTDDYRYAMEDITQLYRHVQDTIVRLVKLSDTRLHRLQKCLQLKEFDEECNKVISWLHTQGNECLQRHLVMADNLKGIRAQQKEFEKFYFAAMTHIEKGNDLLEEASILAQAGDFDEVTGYKELARMLRRHLQQFSERLEETRERIEGASKCYQLLDKTYEWALEAMKYVASMKMEHCATPEGLDKLLRSLELYLQEHPPISDETFNNMTEIAKKINNDKLVEQCRTAHNRCKETRGMLTLRGNTLQQFKDQLENESSSIKSSPKSLTASPRANQNSSSDMSKNTSYSTISQSQTTPRVSGGDQQTVSTSWEPAGTSTPIVPNTYSRTHSERARSVASFSSSSSTSSSPAHSIMSPSSPCHSSNTPCPPSSNDTSPAHMFTPPYTVMSRSGGQGLGHDLAESYGASDVGYVSQRVTTAIPKVLTDRRLYQCSKENLREDITSDLRENFSLIPQKDNSSIASGMTGVSQRNRPAKKILRRAISSPNTGLAPPITEEDSGAITTEGQGNRVSSLRGDGRPDSMITGSSDSLPSLPEEEEGVVASTENQTSQSLIHKEWTPVPVNSHLTEQSNNTPLRPLADLKLTEAEIKSRRTLSLIMGEMVQTERDYVCSLRYIVENYIPEMEREDVPQALRGKRNVIFGNIEKIYQFHQQYFLQEIEVSKRNPFLIARYFLMHEQQFYLYTLYNKNKPKSDNLMAEYGKSFFREKQLMLNDKMDLSSYLLKPVQRMGKYALMIKQIIKECPTSALEYQDLKAAEEMVRFQLRHGNDLLAMDVLKECDVNLQEQGKLLRQDEFLVYQGRRKFMRHVFLFEDLILFSKTKRVRRGCEDSYLYKRSFKMSDIGITENFEGSDYKFEIWWRRRSSGESYVLQAQSSEHKRCWVRDISKLLWNQAFKNRENRMSELATMGIGNKPCLDIKPSSDNIQDRFINVAVGNRGARCRNSIAVCGVDHLRQGNKRPHSIISVGSNSSSNSSNSGASFGAMNLAFNPIDSPRTYRRSLTFMSSESGIGTSISSGQEFDSTLRYDNDLSRTQSPVRYTDYGQAQSVAGQHGMEREYQKTKIMNMPTHTEEVTDV